MRGQRLGLELGVELAAEEPGMVGGLHDLDEAVIGIDPGEDNTGVR